ncbi:MAG: penicillin acylase family protein [bacterium]
MKISVRLAIFLAALLWYFPESGFAEPKAEYGKIEILRDPWGVPHVFAETDEGAFFGLGYACAEDRAFQMYYGLRIVQGRVSEILGDRPLSGRRGQTTVDLDKMYRIQGFYRAAQRLFPNLDAEIRALLTAYSEGVNEFIQTHRAQLLYLFGELGLEPEPWTPADCIASWWRLGHFFAGDGLNEAVRYHELKGDTQPPARETARPAREPDRPAARGEESPRDAASRRPAREMRIRPDDAAAVVQPGDVSEAWIQQVQDFAQQHGIPAASPGSLDGPKFSHAWVVGKGKTTTKSAVLCSDPQTPVRNPSLFYEFHIAGKTFNARGIGVPGSPVILIGWNEQVAWGVTALGADQADLFLLQTDPGHPNQYRFDGEWREIKVRTETIRVKGKDPVPLELKESHWGPIVTPLAAGLLPGEEAALKRIPMCETDRETVQGSLAMMRAQDSEQFTQALSGWRFPSANLVFGDSGGQIGFWTLGAIPVRSRLALDAGNAAHPGMESQYDWPGIIPSDLMPHVIDPRAGVLFSANHRPIASFYPLSIGISTGSLGDTVRSWRLRQLLTSKETFTPDEVLQVHFDTVNAAKKALLKAGYHLRDEVKSPLPDPAVKTLEYLEEWFQAGAKSDHAIRGTELVDLLNLMFRAGNTELAMEYGGGESGLCRFLKSVETRLGENPPAKLSDQESEYIGRVLAAAWDAAVNRYGEDPGEWPAKARQELRERKIGYMDSLDGLGPLDEQHDLAFPGLACVDGGTIFSQAAQSYSQWVPLHEVDSARSLLPIGNSEHPGSPYRLCTYELWAKGELHPAPLTRAAVEKHVVETRVLSK